MLPFDESYEPDDILMDVDALDDEFEYSKDTQELDFDSPDIIKASVENFLIDVDMHKELFY